MCFVTSHRCHAVGVNTLALLSYLFPSPELRKWESNATRRIISGFESALKFASPFSFLCVTVAYSCIYVLYSCWFYDWPCAAKSAIQRLAQRKSRATSIYLLPLWAFMAGYRMNFTCYEWCRSFVENKYASFVERRGSWPWSQTVPS
jgi:hypothetical protein